MVTFTFSGVEAAAFLSVSIRLPAAPFSAVILEVPVESVSSMEPELSSTSETHSLVWPQTTVVLLLTSRWS